MAISSNGVAGLKTGVCTSTTRPSGPYEGQMIYETDTDMVAIWNGTAWRYLAATTATSGSVLQVVSATKTDAQALTPTAYVYNNISGLSVSITPKSTSSKIMIFSTVNGMSAVGANDAFLRFARDGSGIGVGDAAGSRTTVGGTLNKLSGGSMFNCSMSYMDSPASTSALTYSSQIVLSGGGTIYVNRTEVDVDINQYSRASSSITVMEIAG